MGPRTFHRENGSPRRSGVFLEGRAGLEPVTPGLSAPIYRHFPAVGKYLGSPEPKPAASTGLGRSARTTRWLGDPRGSSTRQLREASTASSRRTREVSTAAAPLLRDRRVGQAASAAGRPIARAPRAGGGQARTRTASGRPCRRLRTVRDTSDHERARQPVPVLEGRTRLGARPWSSQPGESWSSGFPRTWFRGAARWRASSGAVSRAHGAGHSR